MTGPGCVGHGSLADELREYVGGALDVLEPLVERIRNQQPDPDDPEPSSCAVCPVCALITVLHGGRSELAARLAEQVSGLLSVLRTALDEGIGADGGAEMHPPTEPGPGPEPTVAPRPEQAGRRETHLHPEPQARLAATHSGLAHLPHRGPRVQRIPVDRDGRWLASGRHPESC